MKSNHAKKDNTSIMFKFNLRNFYILLLCSTSCHKGTVGFDVEPSITGLYTGPYFDPLANTNLTAHLGDRAVLPCTVRQLGDQSVSWVRMRDADILTVDRYTFVSDERFEARFSAALETWYLIIKYVQERDAGIYECQVSTEPKMSQHFNLRVVVPQVQLLPPGDRFVKAGSQVRIECEITDVVQAPDYIFWYHDGVRVLENQDTNVGVRVEKTGEESIKSTLTILRVRRSESGNYTCMPSNLYASSVSLHVLDEVHREAMKDGRNSSCEMERPILLIILLAILTAYTLIVQQAALPENCSKKSIEKSGHKILSSQIDKKRTLVGSKIKIGSENWLMENLCIFMNLDNKEGSVVEMVQDGGSLKKALESTFGVDKLQRISGEENTSFGSICDNTNLIEMKKALYLANLHKSSVQQRASYADLLPLSKEIFSSSFNIRSRIKSRR